MSSVPQERWAEWREELVELLDEHESVTVLSHIRPDPDAIGTSLGVYRILKQMGKRVEVVNASKDLPTTLDFLPDFDRIKHRIDYDRSLVISCDCGSLDRLGFEGLEERVIVNIDHHLSNTRFGRLSILDPNAVSSSEMAFKLFDPLQRVDREVASAFYAALISDTRHFTTSNVTTETFELARRLMERGADAALIAGQMLLRRSLASLRILGSALNSLRLYQDAEVAVMAIRREDLRRAGARSSDLDGVVDYARSLVTVDVAVLLVEEEEGVKVSLRSKGRDLLPVAEAFGGGGHREAAGFECKKCELDETLGRVLEFLKETRSEERS